MSHPEGRLIYSGDEPPHTCRQVSKSGLNINAIWQCGCGKFYKLKRFHDLYDGAYHDWVEVKNAKGDEWAVKVIPREEYITRIGVWRDTCSEHGKVRKKHVHKEKV